MAHYYLPSYVNGEFITIQTINIFTIAREWDIRKSERKFYSALRRPPIRYSLAGFSCGIQAHSRDLEIITSPLLRRQSGGVGPRKRD